MGHLILQDFRLSRRETPLGCPILFWDIRRVPMSKLIIAANAPQADFYSRLYCPKCNLIYCEKTSHVQGNGFVISSLIPKLKCNKCGGELVTKSFSPEAGFWQGVLAIVGAVLFLFFVAIPLSLLGQSITGMALVFVVVYKTSV
jgi:hypothetical protein